METRARDETKNKFNYSPRTFHLNSCWRYRTAVQEHSEQSEYNNCLIFVPFHWRRWFLTERFVKEMMWISVNRFFSFGRSERHWEIPRRSFTSVGTWRCTSPATHVEILSATMCGDRWIHIACTSTRIIPEWSIVFSAVMAMICICIGVRTKRCLEGFSSWKSHLPVPLEYDRLTLILALHAQAS